MRIFLKVLEELTGQMGESLPFALRAMTTAAAKAGLIDGTLPQQKQEAALRKLMENGKAIASEILPEFGKELRVLANDNNALAKALDQNLAPRLGTTKNVMAELTNELYKGLKPSLMFTLDGFSSLGKESNTLANVIGRVLNGAIFGLVFPLRLVGAAIYDVSFAISEFLGLSDETKKTMMSYIPTIAGMALGFLALYKAIKLVVGGYKAMKTAKEAFKGLASRGAAGMDMPTGTPTTTTKKPSSGKFGKIAGSVATASVILGGLYAIQDGITGTFDRFMNTNERNKAITDSVMAKQKVDVDIKVNTQGLRDLVTVEATSAWNNGINNAYMNLATGGQK